MFCEFCGKEIKESSVYCKFCGSKVGVECENEKVTTVENAPALTEEVAYAIKKKEVPITFEIEPITPFDEGPSQQELDEQNKNKIVMNIFAIAIGLLIVLIFVEYIRNINGW